MSDNVWEIKCPKCNETMQVSFCDSEGVESGDSAGGWCENCKTDVYLHVSWSYNIWLTQCPEVEQLSHCFTCHKPIGTDHVCER